MNYRILLVEDDNSIREIIEDCFESKEPAISVTSADNGNDGLSKALKEDFNAIILDVMLPGIDGFSVIRSIRKKKDVPVIFLTARGREDDVLNGYALGCDDYIVKPFMPNALYAKILALIKRDRKEMKSAEKIIGDISLNSYTLSVKVKGKEIELPPIEFGILSYFFEHPDWVISRDTFLDRVWGCDYFGSDRVVDNHIKKLRKSLGDAGKQIKTVISKGYKLEGR